MLGYSTVTFAPSCVTSDIECLLQSFHALSPNQQRIYLKTLIERHTTPSQHQYLYSLCSKALKCDLMNYLPVELVLSILSYLDARSLARASQVHSSWYHLIQTHTPLWQSLGDMYRYEKVRDRKDFIQRYTTEQGFVLGRARIKKWVVNESSNHPVHQHPNHLLHPGHVPVITCMHVDEMYTIIGNDQGSVFVYDTQSSQFLFCLKGHTGGVWAMHCLNGKLATGSVDRRVCVWELMDWQNIDEEQREPRLFLGHTATIRCLLFSNESRYLVTGSRDSTIRAWLVKTGECIALWRGHSSSVRCLALAEFNHSKYLDPCRLLVLSGAYDHDARLWQLGEDSCQVILRGHSSRIYSVAINASLGLAATGSLDCSIRLWNIENGACLGHFQGHVMLVASLVFVDSSHANNNIVCAKNTNNTSLNTNSTLYPLPILLLSGSADGTIKAWSKEGHCLYSLPLFHNNALTCMLLHRDYLLTACDGAVQLWQWTTGKWVRNVIQNVDIIWRVALSVPSFACKNQVWQTSRFGVVAMQHQGQSELLFFDWDSMDRLDSSVHHELMGCYIESVSHQDLFFPQ